MEETLEKVVRQEHKIRKDDSIRDKKMKTTQNLEDVDYRPQKKKLKDFKNNKPKFKSGGARDVKNIFYANKNNRNNEKRDHQEDVLTVEEITT